MRSFSGVFFSKILFWVGVPLVFAVSGAVWLCAETYDFQRALQTQRGGQVLSAQSRTLRNQLKDELEVLRLQALLIDAQRSAHREVDRVGLARRGILHWALVAPTNAPNSPSASLSLADQIADLSPLLTPSFIRNYLDQSLQRLREISGKVAGETGGMDHLPALFLRVKRDPQSAREWLVFGFSREEGARSDSSRFFTVILVDPEHGFPVFSRWGKGSHELGDASDGSAEFRATLLTPDGVVLADSNRDWIGSNVKAVGSDGSSSLLPRTSNEFSPWQGVSLIARVENRSLGLDRLDWRQAFAGAGQRWTGNFLIFLSLLGFLFWISSWRLFRAHTHLRTLNQKRSDESEKFA